MKKISLSFLLLAMAFFAKAQDDLKVETFYLSNGLKVIMAEEHSQPKVYGSVIVHAGAKNEDPNATGVAHYFEHMMFKGTDRIGTSDWSKEKPYLDSISDLYDQIQATTDVNRRHELQLEINRLGIEASKYAIANETDAILQQMGCTGLNAGTSYDYTVYYNTLPANQLENWMEVYAERFRNPVYRLFQSELETVYEERNISVNEQMHDFSRNLLTESFGEHPYSREIVGLDEHLKNPQPSAMKRFYDKYYVASNMTLLLVGDFNTAQAKALAEKYFSIWPKGEKVVEPTYNLPTFDSRVVKEVKQTPIKVGIIIMPGVKNNHPDELALDVMSEIISGGNGRLDELTTEGKLLAAYLMPFSLRDAGTNVILYVPKLLGQKHEAAEELIWAAIDSVKEGRFSDKLLQSIKMNSLISRKRRLESYGGIAGLLQSLELSGSDYAEWQRDNERLMSLTREDIMAIAKKYYDRNHCTIVRSKMGLPDKPASIKPDWDHLEGHNQGVKSAFAEKIANSKTPEIKPQVLDYKEAVQIVPVSPNCKLYATRNPKNDLFSIEIDYHYGSFDNHNIEQAMNYFGNIGVNDPVSGLSLTPEQYRIEMDCLGGSFWLGSGRDYSYISISGPEENMEKILDLALLKLNNPRHDPQQIKNVVEQLEASKKEAKNDAGTWTNALYEYVLYGDSSDYLNHATIKEIKKMKGEDLVALIQNIFQRDGYVTYVGNSDPQKVAALLRKHNLVRDNVTVMHKRVRKPAEIKENALYYATNKKFIKSDIDLYMPSINFDYTADRAAAALFNQYMGGSMNGIFFQEIREFRSLGYSTYGYFSYDRFNRVPGHYYAYLSTQCDKTNEGIAALRDLMVNFPEREEKFAGARDYIISVRNSNYITFRQIPSTVRYQLEEEKIDYDNRVEITEEIRKMTYDDIKAFHKKYVEGHPVAVFISGNAKKFDLDDLSKFGKPQKVKYDQMIRF